MCSKAGAINVSLMIDKREKEDLGKVKPSLPGI